MFDHRSQACALPFLIAHRSFLIAYRPSARLCARCFGVPFGASRESESSLGFLLCWPLEAPAGPGPSFACEHLSARGASHGQERNRSRQARGERSKAPASAPSGGAFSFKIPTPDFQNLNCNSETTMISMVFPVRALALAGRRSRRVLGSAERGDGLCFF
jgi:hypothetical protein